VSKTLKLKGELEALCAAAGLDAKSVKTVTVTATTVTYEVVGPSEVDRAFQSSIFVSHRYVWE